MVSLIQKKLGLIFRKKITVVSIATVLFLGFGEGSYQIIDGVTAASVRVTTAAPPTLSIASSPSIVNNTIQVTAGKPVTITLSASDPNGYSVNVVSGIWQGSVFYAPILTFTPSTFVLNKSNPASPTLPSGAKISLPSNNNYNNVVFTWTPAADAAPLVLQFEAYNFFANVSHSLWPAITIKTSNASSGPPESTPPSFDASNSAQQSLPIGIAAKIPVIVNADTDGDNVIIAANSLPSGATLSTAAKNAKGQWVSVLTWTPTLKQLGNNVINFTANDFNETAKVNFPITFNVQDQSTPSFSATMPSLQKAVVNTTLTYKVIVIPDAITSNVLITATGLPAGATLSKPVLTGGQQVATLTWKPTKAQLNTSPVVIFTAEDNITGAVPVTFKTTFSVASK